MGKKVIQLIAVMVSVLMLGGCSNTTQNQMVRVSAIGPGASTKSCFYRVAENKDKVPNTVIVKTDVETDTEKIVYETEGNSRIYDSEECGDSILFATTKAGEAGKYSVVYIDDNDKAVTVYESDREIRAIANVNDKAVVCDYDLGKYEFDPNTYGLTPVENGAFEDDAFNVNDAVSVRYHTMEDGTTLILRKEFGGGSFAYEVNGTESTLDSLSGDEFKDLQWGYITDKGGVLYGVAAIPQSTADLQRMNMKVGLGGLRTDQVIKEMLFSVDVTGATNRVLFETSGERIVGYTDKDVYLYRKGIVYKRNLTSEQEEEIGKVQAKDKSQLEFRWIGNKLYVFDDLTGEFITVIQG